MSLKTRGSTFHYQFQLGGHTFRATTGIRNDGKKATRKTAQAIEAAAKVRARADLDAGANPVAPLTLFRAMADWWEEVGYRLKDKNTPRHMAKANEFFGREKMFVDLTTNDVAKFRAWRAGQRKHSGNGELAAASVNRMIATLRAVYARGRKVWGIEPRKTINWAVDRGREVSDRLRILAPDEYRALHSAIDPDYWAFLQVALGSGLRKAETILKWTQVDLASAHVIKTGKGGAKITRPLPPHVMALIRSRIGHHPVYVFTYVAGRTMPEREIKRGKFVPPMTKGRRYPITIAGLNSHWIRARAEAAKLCLSLLAPVPFRWHDLRHTFASDVYAQTRDLLAVQQALGHADAATSKRYTHLFNDALRQAIEAGAAGQAERLGIAPPVRLLPAPVAEAH